ncbi:MAG TPA: META domain-containing protein [Candidatus Paceibacterota bacterium]
MNTLKAAIIAVAILLVACLGWFAFKNRTTDSVVAVPPQATVSALFTNAQTKKSVLVAFDNAKQTATMKMDGADDIVLNQTMSASGARYENASLGLVLWNKGNEITVYEKDVIIFTGVTPTVSTPAPSATSSQGSVPPAPAGNSNGTAVTAPAKIDGATFRLVSHNGVAIAGDTAYTVKFENGQIGARFCNSMGGKYTVKNDVITSQMMSTQMYCGTPAGLMDAEIAFGTILAKGAKFSLVGTALTVFQGKDTLVFTATN